MNKNLSFLLILSLCLCSLLQAQPRVTFVTPGIVRVQWSLSATEEDNHTDVCIYDREKAEAFAQTIQCKTTKEGRVQYLSSELLVEMDAQTGALTFFDRKTHKLLLAEDPVLPREGEPVVQERILYDDASAHMVETANGKVTVKDILRRDTIGSSVRYRNHFTFQEGEALYGLGCHMEDYMNLRGKTQYLIQHNLKATVPVLNSTCGYGLLFDAGCAMKWEKDCIELDAAREIDYYFMKGQNLDQLVAQYRFLTGQCPMMPRYMFGYAQSKERYQDQEELVSTLREYRRRQVPIDMIVQDWYYWPEGWGYIKMDSVRYPNPAAMADSVHAMQARLMVSIWPNPQSCPQERDFGQRGYMLEHSVYDAFSAEARKYYWSYVDREFFSKGFDAWWCDCSEPLDADWTWNVPQGYGWDSHAERYQLNKDLLSDALGAERSNIYSLYHSMGIYENQRAAAPSGLGPRVLNLTRSSYAGQQRYATVTWNGDTHADWASFRQQIPAGLNFMATGCPYWSVDIGSFFVKSDARWFNKGCYPLGVADEGYREYYVRMLQWGTFLPMMRSHGTDTPREIWQFGEPGTPYHDAILKMIRLRYRLLPYIYSLAAKVSMQDYTMARLLAFDFADDAAVLDIKDEYMFGDILVCPVTQPGAVSRSVYLPKGENWIDPVTSQRYAGGQTLEAKAPLDQIPLFVRAGSIIPMTEDLQHSGERKALKIMVFPGKDSSFVLYDDEGDNYNCELGDYTLIPLSWNEKRQTLTIGSRQGSFEGMPETIQMEVITPTAKSSVSYHGAKCVVKMGK